MRKKLSTARRLRRARKAATTVVMEACSSQERVCSVADLIPVVERLKGVSITVSVDVLTADVFGLTTIDEEKRTCSIVLSEQCATREHTLAHELGHIMLDHDHCGMDFLPQVQDEFAGLVELMFDYGGQEEACQNENEAEEFAVEVSKLLEHATRNSHPHIMLWGDALGV